MGQVDANVTAADLVGEDVAVVLDDPSGWIERSQVLAESLERITDAEDGADALAEENRWLLALAARFYQQREDVVG